MILAGLLIIDPVKADDLTVENALAARGSDAAMLGVLQGRLTEPVGVGIGVRRLLGAPQHAIGVVDRLRPPPPMIVSAPPLDWETPDDLPDLARDFIAQLVDGLMAVRARLHAAVGEACCDAATINEAVWSADLDAAALEPLVAALDLGALDGAVRMALSFEARLTDSIDDPALVAALASIPGLRFSSPAGAVLIAGSGDNAHSERAAILIDVGGNDDYDMAGVAANGPSLILDLSGDDEYQGGAVAVRDLILHIDRDGNDTYRTAAGGYGAAVGGIALLHDFAGDDRHEAFVFAQGAAVGGFAALIDEAGNDHYAISARGQGFGGPLGFGALIDRAGNDVYSASRASGAPSYAQGVGAGYHDVLAGGVGLLRDQGGNDRYDSEQFSQGMGLTHGLGVLDDLSGSDSYTAVRVAQGAGVLGGVGVLRDTVGDDGYLLSEGMGQGMGFDAGIGVLEDGDGNDRYQSATLAQGASRGAGFGLLRDRGGDDAYALDGPGDGWGRGHAAPDAVSLGFLIDLARDGDDYLLSGSPLEDPSPAALGGPLAGRDKELPPP